MKKTMIAAAVAASVAAPAAFADVTVYGKIHQSTEQMQMDVTTTIVENGTTAGHDDGTLGNVVVDGVTTTLVTAVLADGATDTDSLDDTNIDSNSSRFGIKGTEDLGNGMSAFFQMEWTADGTDGDALGTARNSFVGVNGDFGKVTVGHFDGPSKAAVYNGIMTGGDYHGANDMASMFYSKGDRVTNTTAYQNSFGGANLTLACAGTDEVIGTTDGNYCGSTTAGISFAASGLNVALATINREDAGRDANVVSANYSIGDLKLGATYEDADNTGVDYQGIEMDTLNDITGIDVKTWGLSAKYAMGNNVLAVGYAKQDAVMATTVAADTADGEASYMTVDLTHNLSKRTALYASYLDKSVEVNTTDTSTTEAIRVELDEKNFSVGIIHSF
jgi:predicted porin